MNRLDFFLAWTRLSNNYFTIIDDKIWDKNQFENCSSRFRWFERFQVFQNPIFTSNEMLNLFPDYFTESQLGNYSKWLNTVAVNTTIYLPVFFSMGLSVTEPTISTWKRPTMAIANSRRFFCQVTDAFISYLQVINHLQNELPLYSSSGPTTVISWTWSSWKCSIK